MRSLSVALMVVICVLSGVRAQAEEPGRFVNLGPGGGGAIFNAIGSPHDPNLLFVQCDMSGVYRSTDGGKSWEMIHCKYIRSAHRCKAAFHPTDANVVYMFGQNKLHVSRDKGKTWTRVSENEPWGAETVTEFHVSPMGNGVMLAATASSTYISTVGHGRSWRKIDAIEGGAVGFASSPVPPNMRTEYPEFLWAATPTHLYYTTNGKSWRQQEYEGLPWTGIVDFTGATVPNTHEAVFYCTIPSKVVDGKFVGGVYRGGTGGWESAMGEGLNTTIGKQLYGSRDVDQYVHLAMAQNDPNVVWVTSLGTGYLPPYFRTVYRTTDGGKTWKATFWWDSRDKGTDNVQPSWLALDFNWGWGGGANSFATNPAHPEWGFYTNNGEIFITSNGGKSWFCGNSRPAKGKHAKGMAWQGTGLEVTVPHDLVFDPFERDKVHGGWSDIGYLRSEDRGKSWTLSSTGSPWTNTFYEILPDPKRKDVIYAAASNHHGIPAWSYIGIERKSSGGVVLSTDGGKTWRHISKDIPDTAVTTLCMDPTSPPDRRTLWAAAFRSGVYKSTDGGTTWQKKSKGLPEDNTHVYMVRRHPDGTLFVSITGKRSNLEFLAPAGVYRSTDGGESWTSIASSLKPLHAGTKQPMPEGLRWINGIEVDPRDSKVVYLTCSAIPRGHDGGAYKTTDGGKTWQDVTPKYDKAWQGYMHAYAVLVDPKRPDTVYLSTGTHGLFVSRDAAGTWKKIEEIPFNGVLKVVLDPHEEGVLWVLTYGGGICKVETRN